VMSFVAPTAAPYAALPAAPPLRAPVHALPALAWPRCPLHGDGPCPPPPPSMVASLPWLSLGMELLSPIRYSTPTPSLEQAAHSPPHAIHFHQQSQRGCRHRLVLRRTRSTRCSLLHHHHRRLLPRASAAHGSASPGPLALGRAPLA
jgi:hypothetical protein